MSKSGKKPRNKMNPRNFDATKEAAKKEKDDWSFDEIARSKTRGRRAW